MIILLLFAVFGNICAQEYAGLENSTFDYSLNPDFKIYTRKCCSTGESFYLSTNQCGPSSTDFIVTAFLTKNSFIVNITEENMHLETGILTHCSPSTITSEEFILLDIGELFSNALNHPLLPDDYCLENTIDETEGILTTELIAAYCPTEHIPDTYDPYKLPLRKCCAIGETVSSGSLECKETNDTSSFSVPVKGIGPITMGSAQFHDIFEATLGYPECYVAERGELLSTEWQWQISNESGELIIDQLGVETSSYCIDYFHEELPMAYVCLSEPSHRQFTQMTPSCQDKGDLCVNKCCPFGQMLNSNGRCIAKYEQTSQENVFVFNNNGSIRRVDNVDFEVGFPECYERGLFITKIEEKGRLLENGSLQFISYDPSECDPYISQMIEPRDFCYDMVEHQNFEGIKTGIISGALICYPQENNLSNRQYEVNYIYSIFLIISDIFIFISFIIYLTVPDQTKRGLNKNVKLGHSILGRILLCFLFSLFFAYLCLIIVKTASDPINMTSNTACISIGVIMYISFLATFFWLNVLCFELWWKCARQERSSGRRWIWYQVYAWGNPILLGSLVIFIEFYPRVGPCFIKPNFGVHSCFFSETRSFGSTAKWIYLNGPVALLLVADLLFFVFTVRSLLQTVNQSHKGTIRKQARQRLRLAFKLFLVMGICWLTEIISAATNTKWYITEVFNCLQGFVIFLIFIMKPKILTAVRNQFCSCCCGQQLPEQQQRGRAAFTASSVLFDFFTSTKKTHLSLSSNNPSISSSATTFSTVSTSSVQRPLPIPSRLATLSFQDSRKMVLKEHAES